MRYEHRIAGMVAVVAVVLTGAGLSAADEYATPPGRIAQAVVGTDTAQPGRTPSEPGATVIDQQDVQGILGRQVLSSANEDMGRVIDIVVDRNGQVRAAVIDFGGFLGVGSRKVAIDWNVLRFAPTGSQSDRITLDLTRDQVKAAPAYKDGSPLVVVGAVDVLPPPY